MSQQPTTDEILYALISIMAFEDKPGVDVPGIYQSPADSYRQGYNYAREKARDTIRHDLLRLADELRSIPVLRFDEHSDEETPEKSYSRGFNEAVQNTVRDPLRQIGL